MTKNITLRGDDGSEVSVTLPTDNMTAEQENIAEKLFREGSPKNLTQDEWDAVRELKASVGGIDGPDALIVRFDWTWVRIDERRRSYDDLKDL